MFNFYSNKSRAELGADFISKAHTIGWFKGQMITSFIFGTGLFINGFAARSSMKKASKELDLIGQAINKSGVQ